MRDYYLPRWQILIDATLAEMKGVKTVDRAALEKKWRGLEKQFADTAVSNYAHQPSGDYFALSRRLFKKYYPMLPKAPASSGHP